MDLAPSLEVSPKGKKGQLVVFGRRGWGFPRVDASGLVERLPVQREGELFQGPDFGDDKEKMTEYHIWAACATPYPLLPRRANRA